MCDGYTRGNGADGSSQTPTAFYRIIFIEAFKSVGGKIHAREKGRYEITSVPFAVRNRDMQIGFGEPVLSRYERSLLRQALL